MALRGSVHHSTIHKEKSNKMQQCIKIFIIPYLYEAQHVSGDTPPIIRRLKLHWQPLVFHTWKVVGRVVGGRCQAHCAWQRPPSTRPTTFHVWKTSVRHTVPDNVHHLHVQQPSMYEKPEAASAILASWWWAVCRPKHVELHINRE